MIRYALKCPEGHLFESWFASAEACDRLVAAAQVACPDCGATGVEKSLMAPKVRPARGRLGPESDREKALAALKARFEAEGDYVGKRFVTEARAIHDGTARERPIYGEAKIGEAIELIEDGVPVAPLPFTPTRKAN
jgi:hypothetical protein